MSWSGLHLTFRPRRRPATGVGTGAIELRFRGSAVSRLSGRDVGRRDPSPRPSPGEPPTVGGGLGGVVLRTMLKSAITGPRWAGGLGSWTVEQVQAVGAMHPASLGLAHVRWCVLWAGRLSRWVWTTPVVRRSVDRT